MTYYLSPLNTNYDGNNNNNNNMDNNRITSAVVSDNPVEQKLTEEGAEHLDRQVDLNKHKKAYQ